MNRIFSHSFLQTIRRETVVLGQRLLNQVGRAYAHQFSFIPKGNKLGSVSYQLFKQKVSQTISPKITLTDISAHPFDMDSPQRNKIQSVIDIGLMHVLFNDDHQKSIENSNFLEKEYFENVHREKQVSEEAQNLSSSKRGKQTDIDLKEVIRNEYAGLSDIPFEESIEILSAISTLFCDQEEESLEKKGKEIFTSAIAQGLDRLTAYAREIEFKTAEILLKMADEGVIFKQREKSIIELQSQLGMLQKKISEYAGNAFDEFREKILQEKNRKINSYIEKHFSFEISGHRSLKALCDDIFETRILQVLLGITNMKGEINPHIQKKLSHLLERENMGYIGVALFMGLKKVLIALQESEGKDSEKMLEILLVGSHQSSVNSRTYKQEVERRVVNRLGNLIFHQNEAEGIFHFLLNQYSGMKAQITRLMIQTLVNQCDRKKTEFLESIKFTDSPRKGKSIEKPQEFLKEFIMEKIGLNSILQRFNQHSDLLFYFMLDTMTEALDDVIHPSNSVNRVSKLDGNESASSLKEAVKNFTSHTTTLLPASLKMILQPFILVIEEQGNTKKVLDVATPLLENIIPKLQYFLKD